MRRHTGEAYELVLDPVVPQLGRDIMEEPGQGAQKFVEHWETLARIAGLDPGTMHEEIFGRRRREREAAEAAEPSEASESRSSNKIGKKGKRRKRRKKKLPKGSSSPYVTSIYGRSGAAANSTAWSPSRVLGQLDTRLDVPRTIPVMRLFSRGTPTQFVKQTRQLCGGAKSWLAAARMEWEELWRQQTRQLGVLLVFLGNWIRDSVLLV